MRTSRRSRLVRRPRWLVVAAAALVAITAAGCADDGSGAPTDPARLVGKTYLSQQVDGEPIPGGGPLEVSFLPGSLAATAGCNRHSGAVRFDGDTMTAGQLVSTMMACAQPADGADRWLSDLFGAPLTWQLDGTTLTLSRGSLRVKLVERTNRPVIGTRWQVTALVEHDAVTSSKVLDESKPYLLIDASGAVSGSTGCNRMTGTATVTDDTVTFAPLATTRMACDAETSAVERSVLTALTGETKVVVDGDHLTLTNVADRSVGLRLTAAAE
ncbi:MAG: META domain-containing protein [Gordonia sp. (in: high G+C Gram-positive bacteria)]|uniref:META domain-containing protein n=1 Tax=Gordonia sp. (in: high G+C Gram-positive bacteria) TaxID=84139 RepID=UPI003C710A5D